ncbi:carbamoyltransferase HypF [Actinoallomurus vinaceus]|uniref:Carbamoyltransferase n=1 Tax=Actinoallomurus vinaceus TaxID=1080074 RepID=A0ABP8U0A4_9ACTN
MQGVGFRPYVHSLARRLDLAGWVGNDAHGVFVEVEGPPDALTRFQEGLRDDPPPLAMIRRMTATRLPVRGERGFRIAPSRREDTRETLISPDVATCADCLAELFDPADRRYRYPFVNCTNCGPRFTIIRDVPYDRPVTTMAGFALCEDCAAEYHDPGNRRFHAQPTCCPACGPTLRGASASGEWDAVGDPIVAAVEVLRAGGVLAVKGLGGYHLAVDARDEQAARRLRSRKHREDKPFAVMVPDLEAARRLCLLDPVAERLLTGPRRPIVLLPRRPGAPLAEAVAPGNRELGIMLPYTPLHHLLARELGRPYVLTSGNVSDEPIAYLDADAYERLAGIADRFLTHDRPIHIRTDDSVVRVVRGRERPLRRSRGYAPQPVWLARPVPSPVLGCGAELKNTFCLAKGDRAFVSHHIGDLENYETLRSFTEGIAHFRRLFDVTPRVVAHDLHPEYLSTKYALALDDVELVGVQHHHAHIASCLADNREDGPVIGVAYDGTGFGADGTIWGGELLVADLAGFSRAGLLAPVPLPGGTTAIRQPWRMAAAHLDAAYDGALPPDLDVEARHRSGWDDVLAVARSGVNSPLTSSAGRLFDAVAAILGVRDAINFEGQAAIELEQRADPAETAAYPAAIDDGDPLVIRVGDLVRAVVADLRGGVPAATVAARFHHGLADATVTACRRLSAATGIGTVALSGGVFQNRLLLGRVADGLERHGLRVLTHQRVPPNDGGISLGQVAVAAARHDRRR